MAKREYKHANEEFYFQPPANRGQHEMRESVTHNDITIAIGPAGCGKTYMALMLGLQLLRRNDIDQIYYVRNPIDYRKFGSQGVGYLKGGYEEKTDLLLNPIKDNLYCLCDQGKAKALIRDERIYPLIPDYIQGMSWSHKYVIVDESQNCPPELMEMILTRMAKDTKIVVVGDPRQKATKLTHGNGIIDAAKRLGHIDGVGVVYFRPEDAIIRHELIPEISAAYEDLNNDLT